MARELLGTDVQRGVESGKVLLGVQEGGDLVEHTLLEGSRREIAGIEGNDGSGHTVVVVGVEGSVEGLNSLVNEGKGSNKLS